MNLSVVQALAVDTPDIVLRKRDRSSNNRARRGTNTCERKIVRATSINTVKLGQVSTLVDLVEEANCLDECFSQCSCGVGMYNSVRVALHRGVMMARFQLLQ